MLSWNKFKYILKKFGYEDDEYDNFYKYFNEKNSYDKEFHLIRITVHEDKVVFFENNDSYVSKKFKTFDDILSVIIMFEK